MNGLTHTRDLDELRYLRCLRPEPAYIANARRLAQQTDNPPLDPESSALLSFLVTLTKPRRVLELGTGAGVSGLHVLAAMNANDIDKSVYVTVDIDPEHTEQAHLLQRTHTGKVDAQYVTADALSYLTELTRSFDIIIVDIAKPLIVRSVTMAWRCLHANGLMFIDNQWWSGRPILSEYYNREEDRQVRTLNELLPPFADAKSVQLPMGDGPVLIYKTVVKR